MRIRNDSAYFNSKVGPIKPKGSFTISLLNQLSNSKHCHTSLKYDSVKGAETVDQGVSILHLLG